MVEELNLKINGKKIALSEFPEAMLKNLILAYTKSLKGVPEEINQINIEINL